MTLRKCYIKNGWFIVCLGKSTQQKGSFVSPATWSLPSPQSFPIVLPVLAWVAGAKRGGGGGREKSAKEGKREGVPYPLSVISLFFPSSLSPTPFDAGYAGYLFENDLKLNVKFIFILWFSNIDKHAMKVVRFISGVSFALLCYRLS